MTPAGGDDFISACFAACRRLVLADQRLPARLPLKGNAPWLNLRRYAAPDAPIFLPRGRYTRPVTDTYEGGGAMRVYMDLVILLNFLVDLLLLLGTNRLSGFPPGLKRAALGAALGAAYSGLCLLPGLRFLGNILWRLVSLGLMAVTAFGVDRSAVKRAGVFVLLSMALGGIAVGFGKGGFFVLLAAAAGVWVLCRIGFGGSVGGREYVPLEIRHQGKAVHLTALRDSGNTLRDPITGEQVLVIDAAAAGELTGLSAEQLRSPLETMARQPISGLRLIPYRAVGQPGGMLLAMRFSDVRVGNAAGAALVAFAPDVIGRGEGYRALTGGVL